jgi:hypothetical protein
MKVTLENTTKIVHINGVPARVWEGTTDSGIACHAFITRIAVALTADAGQFTRELLEQRAPSPEVEKAYDARLVL